MAILSTGNTFGDTDTVTSTKLNNIANAATFASGAVDDVSTELSNGAIVVKNGGVTPSKLSAGAPSWNTSGVHTFPSNGSNGSLGLELNYNVAGNGNVFIDFHSTSASNPDYDARIIKDTGDNSNFNFENQGNGNMTFHQNGSEKMRIDSQGTLIVGTTDANPYDNIGNSPGIAFHGNGSVEHGLITSCRYQNAPASFNRTGSDGTLIDFRREGAFVGSIEVTTNGASFNTSSDYRLKEDVIEMEGSLDRLKALKPCNFRWISDGTRVDGFLAHEAQEVVPEAVTGTKDAIDDEGNPDYQGIDQAKLVPLLTKALQEAVAKIESLEARVAALES